jgi:glycosyltransferase involved in cell wall biosynthesis
MTRFPRLGIPNDKYAIFCASAHPPNIHGFFKYLAGRNASLAGERSLVIVGSSGDAIRSDKRYEHDIYFKSRVVFTGVIESDLVSILVRCAHVNLLPIDDGEGSNLKAAEALASGAYIVATSKALRGFEFAKDLPHVFIADDPLEFKQSVRACLSLSPCRIDQETRIEIMRRISWESCFTSLGKMLSMSPSV